APEQVKIQGRRQKAEGRSWEEGRRKKDKGGWSYDPADRGGVLKIRTGVLPTHEETSITVF
ncbi:MAG: hypothetical protein PHY99_06530, partial [Bacteroidales bacterium]|nr:hypothetical protein [Bacteroidales bacterium]